MHIYTYGHIWIYIYIFICKVDIYAPSSSLLKSGTILGTNSTSSVSYNALAHNAIAHKNKSIGGKFMYIYICM
jgi:3-hydroxyacyl-CoA dehydrogenase